MRALITNWTAMPMNLRIRVATEPLAMAKDYVWVYHTTNYYGQGAKHTWWHYREDQNPDVVVYGDEAQELLTSLVRDHSVLSLLASYYKIPEVSSSNG